MNKQKGFLGIIVKIMLFYIFINDWEEDSQENPYFVYNPESCKEDRITHL